MVPKRNAYTRPHNAEHTNDAMTKGKLIVSQMGSNLKVKVKETHGGDRLYAYGLRRH